MREQQPKSVEPHHRFFLEGQSRYPDRGVSVGRYLVPAGIELVVCLLLLLDVAGIAPSSAREQLPHDIAGFLLFLGSDGTVETLDALAVVPRNDVAAACHMYSQQ